MAKSYKKAVGSLAAAVLVTSAVVPVISVSADTPASQTLSEVVFTTADGKLVKLTYDQYIDSVVDGLFNFTQGIDYLVDNEGNTFDFNDYADTVVDNGVGTTEALAALKASGKEVTEELNIAPGKVVNGVVVTDPTPEENSNETFFYNLAA